MGDLKPLKSVKNRQSGLLNVYLIVAVVVLVVLGLFVWGKFGGPPAVFDYVFGQGSSLKTDNGRVNVLLLGIAGEGHDGPNLTDTIMVASYDTTTNKVSLISLPRDLWIDTHKAKVNTIYTIGLKKGDGLGLSSKEIGDVLGLNIPYTIRLDFSGFTKAIDLVGGVDVNVTQTFDDYEYPVEGKADELCGYSEKEIEVDEGQSKELKIPVGTHKALFDTEGKMATISAELAKNTAYTEEQTLQFFSCRFERLSFKQGPLHLDGTTALKYVRSRHGNNDEGTDFARSKRQQQVIQAFKDKVLSMDTLFDPKKVIELVQTLGKSVETNIPQSEYLGFIKMAKQTKGVKSFVIDGSGKDPLLVTPPQQDYGGAWVLVPAGNDLSKLHQFVTASLADEAESSSSAKPQ